MVDARERVLQLVRRHGWNATAFQTLERGYSYYFDGDDACVAYVDTGRAWVVAGAPIAATEALASVVANFLAAARAAGRRCCFFATEERLQSATGSALRALRIGEQPVWDPGDWNAVVAGHKSLREQLRRARAKGVEIREAELGDPLERAALAHVAERWLATRSLAPMEFLVGLELFSFPAERRCFVAHIRGQPVGFAGVVPVPLREGWFLEDLVQDPAAPNGTGELLVDAVMRWAAERGSSWVTLGLAPLAGDVPAPLRLARRGTALFFDFDGLRNYKAKLRPNAWTPIYLSLPRDQGLLISIVDALAAFTRGGFLGFGLRTLLRGPQAAVRVLAVLLVPWTALLAFAPAERWFGAAWVKWSWIVFDLLLVAGMFRFLRRPGVRLASALALAVSADALLTLVQALCWNLPRARGFAEHALLAAACLAPALAALVLWGARKTRLLTR